MRSDKKISRVNSFFVYPGFQPTSELFSHNFSKCVCQVYNFVISVIRRVLPPSLLNTVIKTNLTFYILKLRQSNHLSTVIIDIIFSNKYIKINLIVFEKLCTKSSSLSLPKQQKNNYNNKWDNVQYRYQLRWRLLIHETQSMSIKWWQTFSVQISFSGNVYNEMYCDSVFSGNKKKKLRQN